MPYQSEIDLIWAKLSTEGSTRRPTTSRETFHNVVDAFLQAEECPESPPASSDVQRYRAEYNIWAYYFGENISFPGISPTALITPASISRKPSEEASQMRQNIESLWLTRRSRQGYVPKLGWDPQTGEPYMAVRSYAENSYPALSGDKHSYLYALQKMAPEFQLQYERFPHIGYTLIWPEFVDAADLMNQGAWKRFGQFRAFLAEWASHTGNAPNIHESFKRFLEGPRIDGLALPDGFVLDPNLLCAGGVARAQDQYAGNRSKDQAVAGRMFRTQSSPHRHRSSGRDSINSDSRSIGGCENGSSGGHKGRGYHNDRRSRSPETRRPESKNRFKRKSRY